MNVTIARLTWRSLLGRRRAILLLVLPVVLLLLALAILLIQGQDAEHAVTLLSTFALGLLIPLLGLIAGTGAIGPEIDDGSIVYLLAKPISRYTIVLSKLLTAIVVVTAFGALPTLAAGLMVAGGTDRIALGFALGALVAGLAYSALFLLLAILTRNAVVVGLMYALIWESVVGGYVPGAQALSVQQWSLALTEKVVGASAAGDLGISAAVGAPAGLILLLALIVAATAYAGWRLRSIRVTSAE